MSASTQDPTDELDGDIQADIFKEPDGYYEPEKPPTQVCHTLLSGEAVTLRLVGHNPLWGHLLWNAGRIISDYLEERGHDLVRDRDVLELGAGAGLPSLVCATLSARKVVVTDYPDSELIDNLRINISSLNSVTQGLNINAEGYLWGSDTQQILSHLDDASAGFDLLILADVLFNHSEHHKLVATIQKTLKKTTESRALVFFTPYRPWLLNKDLAFFGIASEAGFHVDKVFEKVMDKVMFDEDPGDELLRRTVYGYELRW
ncbi:MAG: nicotinamide n-methyltransferase [Thelocarpon impressellum]|nr:MAG: nicotinamide n-methyltransferase [Thelocarpon impressellum]